MRYEWVDSMEGYEYYECQECYEWVIEEDKAEHSCAKQGEQ